MHGVSKAADLGQVPEDKGDYELVIFALDTCTSDSYEQALFSVSFKGRKPMTS